MKLPHTGKLLYYFKFRLIKETESYSLFHSVLTNEKIICFIPTEQDQLFFISNTNNISITKEDLFLQLTLNNSEILNEIDKCEIIFKIESLKTTIKESSAIKILHSIDRNKSEHPIYKTQNLNGKTVSDEKHRTLFPLKSNEQILKFFNQSSYISSPGIFQTLNNSENLNVFFSEKTFITHYSNFIPDDEKIIILNGSFEPSLFQDKSIKIFYDITNKTEIVNYLKFIFSYINCLSESDTLYQMNIFDNSMLEIQIIIPKDKFNLMTENQFIIDMDSKLSALSNLPKNNLTNQLHPAIQIKRFGFQKYKAIAFKGFYFKTLIIPKKIELFITEILSRHKISKIQIIPVY